MNIVHVLSSLNWGGKEQLVVDLAQINHKDKANNYSIIIINRDYKKEMLKLVEPLNVNFILLNRPPGKSWTTLLYARHLRKALNQIQPDIIHVHDKISFLCAWIAARGLTAKTVYTLHNTHLYSPSIRDRLLKALVLSRTDAFIAISLAVQKNFSNNKKFLSRTSIVYNGINVGRFMRAREFNKLPIRLICVAKLKHLQKGQDMLIQAISLLKKDRFDIECFLVGEGSSRDYIQALIKDYGLQDRIFLLGNRNDVPALLASSHIFVLPSRYEGLGIVIIEAMAAGLPIVASNVDGIAELIENGNTGLLFKSEDVQDLAKNIKTIIENSPLRKRLIHNASTRVENFTIKKMYNNYLSVYSSVLSESAGNGLC